MSVATYLSPLWDFLDVTYDVAARHPLNLDVADIYMAAEDFCKHIMVPDDVIPPVHKHMFSLRKEGFMVQAKYPWYSSKEWIHDHPTPLVPTLQVDRDSILYQFEDFLIPQQDEYHCVLCELYRHWLTNTKEFYVVYDANGVALGRAITWNEADAICDKQPLYQWDIKKNNRFASLPIITVTDV